MGSKNPRNSRKCARHIRQNESRRLVIALLALALLASFGCTKKSAQPQQSLFSLFFDEMDAFFDRNLPLVVTDITVYYESSNHIYRITPDGLFQHSDVWGFGIIAPQAIDWKTIDSEVRSFANPGDYLSPTYLYIKNDNSLWGFGNNKEGILGDGTGVNKSEPVKIMEDVAEVGVYRETGSISRASTTEAYAIKTDKSLWTWGNGVYSPVLKAQGVIKYNGRNQVETSSGFLVNTDTNAILREPVLCHSKNFKVDLNGRLTVGSVTYENVVKVLDIDGYLSTYPTMADNVFFIKSDNTLWGYGSNAYGELGDSTKVPRTDGPVKIADNVREAYYDSYLTTDGQLWRWGSVDPTPKLYLENVSEIIDNYSGYDLALVKLADGTNLYCRHSMNSHWEQDKTIDASEVKKPETRVFP